MQELLDKPAPAAPTYAANDPVNNTDPDGRRTRAASAKFYYMDPIGLDVSDVHVSAFTKYKGGGDDRTNIQSNTCSYDANAYEIPRLYSKWKVESNSGMPTSTIKKGTRGWAKCTYKKAVMVNYDPFPACDPLQDDPPKDSQLVRTKYEKLWVKVAVKKFAIGGWGLKMTHGGKRTTSGVACRLTLFSRSKVTVNADV